MHSATGSEALSKGLIKRPFKILCYSEDGMSNLVEEAQRLLVRRRSLVELRAQTNFEISEIDRRLSELCNHDWEWHQVAGEGRYCTKCGKRDFDCDD